MKKSVFALAVLSATGAIAHAQSSVTLYGIVDEGFSFNNNAGGERQYRVSSGSLQGSRFGFRGTEDLGGSVKALFVLENGFDMSTGKLGQGGLMFGRQAYVGLSSRLGKITLGRQYDSVVDYVGRFEGGTQWGGYITSHPGDLDNLQNDFRTNNAVKYTSADYNGFKFGAAYSFGGQAGNFTGNQIWSLGAGYDNGPLSLGAGIFNARQPGQPNGMLGNGTTAAGASAVSTPVFAGYQSANTYQVIGAGAAYQLGAATIGATYANTRFSNLGVTAPTVFRKGDTAALNNAEVSLKYQLTPFLLLGTEFDYTRGSAMTLANGTANSRAQYYHGSVAADYFLSKRTDVYIIASYEQASGTDSTNKPAVAAITNLTPSTTNRQFAASVGIHHRF